MKTAYELFEILMDEEKVYLDESMSFEDICLLAGTEKDALESVLIEELGIRGDTMLDIYRETTAP